MIPAYHFDDSFGEASGEAALIFIDTLNDSVEILEEQRCGGFSTSVLTDAGDLYVASDPYVDALRRVGGDTSAPPGCLLRGSWAGDACAYGTHEQRSTDSSCTRTPFMLGVNARVRPQGQSAVAYWLRPGDEGVSHEHSPRS